VSDYSTEFSTSIEIKEETEAWLVNFLGEDTEGESFLNLIVDEYEDSYSPEYWGFNWNIVKNNEICKINIFSNGDGNEDCAIRLIQAILEHEQSQELIFFQTAYTCSRDIIGAFGGGNFVISRKYARGFDYWEWYQDQLNEWDEFLEKEDS
jgi:hypothetical protein